MTRRPSKDIRATAERIPHADEAERRTAQKYRPLSPGAALYGPAYSDMVVPASGLEMLPSLLVAVPLTLSGAPALTCDALSAAAMRTGNIVTVSWTGLVELDSVLAYLRSTSRSTRTG